ncbi:MAG TPA: hypothetical protein GX526_02200 [Thermoanaerobacterales bacterium]|nr:hypothetical protein [Thermoanaerobacterales bacterium]
MDIYKHINKVVFLEKRIGHITNYSNLEPFRVDPEDILDIQKAAKKISQFVGLNKYIFIVTVAQLENNIAGHVNLKRGEREVFIEISRDITKSSQSVLATLAHEITHKYIHDRNLFYKKGLIHTYENEIFTDITAVFLGLGKLMLNGCEMGNSKVERRADGIYDVNTLTKVGYLKREELAFVYRLICSMRKVPRREMLNVLSRRALLAIKSTYKHDLDYFNEQFHERSYKDKLLGSLIADIKILKSQLEQINEDLEFIRTRYILKTEEHIKEKNARINTILRDLKCICEADTYDPCLLFLYTINLSKEIQQMQLVVKEDIYNLRNIKSDLNMIRNLY